MAKQRELDIRVDQSCLHPRGNYTIYRIVIQRLLGCNKEEKVVRTCYSCVFIFSSTSDSATFSNYIDSSPKFTKPWTAANHSLLYQRRRILVSS